MLDSLYNRLGISLEGDSNFPIITKLIRNLIHLMNLGFNDTIAADGFDNLRLIAYIDGALRKGGFIISQKSGFLLKFL